MDLIAYLVSFVSYRLVVVCLASVPVTHCVGVYLHCPRYFQPWRYLLFFFTGGNRHVAFQLLGWVLWGFAALLITPVALSSLPLLSLPRTFPVIPRTHVDVVSGAAAVCSFVGELAMVKAILAFDPSSKPQRGGAQAAWQGRFWPPHEPHPVVASALVVVMGVLLSVTGTMLLLALDYMPDIPSRVLYCCLSLSCLLIAASSTYGLGGFLRYGQASSRGSSAGRRAPARKGKRAKGGSEAASAGAPAGSGLSAEGAAATDSDTADSSMSSERVTMRAATGKQGRLGRHGSLESASPFGEQAGIGVTVPPARATSAAAAALGVGDAVVLEEHEPSMQWQFWQPFSGGGAFVATQALGWSVFSAAIVLIVILVQQLVAGVAHCIRCWALGAGAMMLLAQALLGISLVTYRGKPLSPAARSLIRTASTAVEHLLPPKGASWAACNMPIILMYLPMHFFFTLWTLAFTFMPSHYAIALWAGGMATYYAVTTSGHPHHTGCRRWAWLCDWMSRNIELSLAYWFGSVTVIHDLDAAVAGEEAAAVAAAAAGQEDADATAAAVAGGDKGTCAGVVRRRTTDEHPSRQAVLLPSSCNGGAPSLNSPQQQQQQQEKESNRNGKPGEGGGCECTSSLQGALAAPEVEPSAPGCLAHSIYQQHRRQDQQQRRQQWLERQQQHGAQQVNDGASTVSSDQDAQEQQQQRPQDGDEPLVVPTTNPQQRYVFAFQPHGLYPTGAGFLPLMPSFRSLFPGVSPVTLTASVMFVAPFIREIACWAGFRQCTRRTFVKALREKGAVLLCPGGQAEMVHAYRAFKSPTRELVLHVRHKGFVRVAIENQAALVPVLALGEGLQLRNIFDLPAVQQYTYRRLGFPVPYMLTGRWRLTPLPMRVPLVYVVGRPIQPPRCEPGTPVPQDAVDALHAAYVSQLVALFHRHKGSHPLLKHARLVLADD